ncbi:hypothetical protein LQF12_14960 [Ruania suaedae]|uniref:hypothetical protein n=1 Tax=Ruania suaedae TaxID=2897774 RepID=UPI001E5ADDA3|nr:hypothetical protein [Ruania suaedae]UFU02766.1 hypothetical protein LQF12_14960 [Ruania suaedae]
MTGAADPGAAPLDLPAALSRHVLALPDDVTAEEVEALALSRYPQAHWVTREVLELEEETYLAGPFLLTAADRSELALPVWAEHAYLLTCPAERGGPVPEELQAVGGLLAAFAQGSVEGMERAAVDVLCAMGRRLAGVVRTSTGYVLEPGPTAGVDLVVHAPVWLHPDALVHVLTPALPGVRLLAEPDRPRTPSSSADRASNAEQLSVRRAGVDGVRELDEAERAWLHAEADAFDAHTLAQPQVTEAYGAVYHYPDGGSIGVSVEAEAAVPLVLAGLDWAAGGTLTYALRWYPADPVALQQGRVGQVVLDQREDARARIEAGARALQAATDGEVTDDDQFLVRL